MANGYKKVVGIVHSSGTIQASGIVFDNYVITRIEDVNENFAVYGKPCRVDTVKAAVMHQFVSPDKVKDLINKDVYIGFSSGNNPKANFVAVHE